MSALCSVFFKEAPIYDFVDLIGKRPWTLLPKVHIALPGATQNEVSKEEAEALIKAGVRIVAEGSNMVRASSNQKESRDIDTPTLSLPYFRVAQRKP